MSTTVVNIRDKAAVAAAVAAGAYVRIDRATKWGNPFRLGREQDRAEVLARYREWLMGQPHLLAALHELRGKVLGCWCSPRACHGHVLAELADATTGGW